MPQRETTLTTDLINLDQLSRYSLKKGEQLKLILFPQLNYSPESVGKTFDEILQLEEVMGNSTPYEYQIKGAHANSLLAYAKLLHAPKREQIEQWDFIRLAADIDHTIVGFLTAPNTPKLKVLREKLQREVNLRLTTLCKQVLAHRAKELECWGPNLHRV